MGSEKKRKMPEDFPYFRKAPAGVVKLADVLLTLDSGEELPVHSAFLFAHSQTFFDILSTSSAEAPQRLPLPNCNKHEALVFLSYLYAANPAGVLSCDIEHAKIVAAFAHKFAMASVLDHCDKWLASKTQVVHVSITLQRKRRMVGYDSVLQ